MSDLKSILAEEYRKQNSRITRVGADLSLKNLMEMVEDVFSTKNTSLAERITSDISFGDQTMTLSMIPEIAVSELGWSDVATGEEGSEIAGPQRQLLQGYLDNIAGDTLSAKLASLDKFYQEGYVGIGADNEDSRARIIKNTLSYLVFYKTLTTVITNFNAASAGFSFESFLATLLKGRQVPANTGTIADFIAGEEFGGEYISLKLYNEGSVEVGGSFSDLVDDVVNDNIGNKMRYLVVLKNLKGAGLNQRGALTFYTFEFTLENIADIIAAMANEKYAKCIIFPLIKDPAAPGGARLATPGEEEIPGRIKVTPEQFNNLYKNTLKDYLVELSVYPEEVINKIIQMPEFTYGDGEYVGKGTSSIPVGVAQRELRQAFANTKYEEALADTQYIKGITGALKKAMAHAETILKKDPTAARKATISQILPQFKNITYPTKKRKGNVVKLVQQSRDWYNQQDDTTKKQALQLSNGYLNTLKFSMNKTLSTTDTDPVNAQNLGVINVGAEYIERMLSQVRDILNAQVFEIFTSLKDLSDNLNNYFASGLANDAQAENAINDAENIQSKTEEIRDK